MTENEVLVSVIVLTYNHEKYICQALDSILMQKVNFKFEILIGDDASTDGTSNIVRQYQEKYPNIIKAYLREDNLGAARNAYELLMVSTGKYLAFCEGDDYWTDPDKLSRQVCFLEENPHFIGCSHRCEIVDGNGMKKEDQRLSWVRERECFTLEDFRGIYLPGQTATIVKCNLFRSKEEDYSFLYEINPNISDRTTTLLYLSKGPFGFIPKTMSAYRRVENTGITNQMFDNNPNRIRDELAYTDRLVLLAEALATKKEIFADYYKQLYAWAVWQYFKYPTRDNRVVIAETAARIGRGSIHPIAFVHGMLQKLGKL